MTQEPGCPIAGMVPFEREFLGACHRDAYLRALREGQTCVRCLYCWRDEDPTGNSSMACTGATERERNERLNAFHIALLLTFDEQPEIDAKTRVSSKELRAILGERLETSAVKHDKKKNPRFIATFWSTAGAAYLWLMKDGWSESWMPAPLRAGCH